MQGANDLPHVSWVFFFFFQKVLFFQPPLVNNFHRWTQQDPTQILSLWSSLTAASALLVGSTYQRLSAVLVQMGSRGQHWSRSEMLLFSYFNFKALVEQCIGFFLSG